MKVGIVGLGIMGGAYAKNLLANGIEVEGADPSEEARRKVEERGGRVHAEVGPWLAHCDLVILALISPPVLREVSERVGGIISPGQIVLETGTFALKDKIAAREAIEGSGAILLDSPVSGTGAQAWNADLVMMIGGPSEAVEKIRPLLSHISHTVIHAGEFGDGTRLKFVANHAVALHNVAAAETLHYADALGLDRETVYKMLSNGAGQSKMSDLRMPLMIEGRYEPPTASLKMFEKDLSVIGDDIERHGVRAPLFEAAHKLYESAWSKLPKTHDTAAVFEVYRSGGA